MITPGTAQDNVVKAVAIACNRPGDPAFRHERETVLKLPAEGGSVDLQRVFDPAADEIRLAVSHILPPGVVQATRVVRVLKYILEDGEEIAGEGELLRQSVGPDPQRHEFSFAPPVRTRTIVFEATLSFCNQQVRDEEMVHCGCDPAQPRSGTLDPVSFEDGNMRYADSDPLPPLLESVHLTRNYDTHHRVRGSFGRGWVSMFEGRLLVNPDPAGQTITLTDQNNEMAIFFGRDGIYRQRWPKGRGATGTLVLEAASGLYVHRPAGATTVSLYRASDGRFAGIRRLGTGREMRITWSAAGLPQSVTDSWTSLTWNITTDAASRRITSIESGGLVWQYQYDAKGNLARVLAPGAAAWRTYAYVNDLMTAARDAAGNLIESHVYDASGRAIDSTGPNDEIATIQYNAPGTTSTQLVTRVTMKSGGVAEYVLQPIGGAWRTVRITGGCASCGTREGVYAYDEDGHLLREQNASGYITVSTYSGQRLASRQQHLRPAGCDPETSATRCMLDPVTLKTAALQPMAATITAQYQYGDPLWPDKPTVTTTPSIVVSGRSRREQFTYHPATGEAVGYSVTGWNDGEGEPFEDEHSTRTVLYGDTSRGGDDKDEPGSTPDPHAPAFNPGGTFQSAWLALPQPHLMRKLADGPRSDVGDVTSFVYYPIDPAVPATLRGRLAAVRNAAGHVVRYESYDVFGNATRVVDANGVATEMMYDALGRLKSSTIKGIAGCDTTKDALCASDLTTTHVYASPAGPLLKEQTPAGGVTVNAYDARGRPATMSRGPSASDLRERIEYIWDSLTGQKSVERLLAFENGAWVEKKRESFGYDTLGRLQTVTHADATSIGYTYDHDGRVATVRDENHAAANTVYTYDPAGRIATVKQTLAGAPGGVITTRYAYDVHGNLTSVTDPNGNITRYEYDDFGHLTEQQSPVTGTTRHQYDEAGNVTLSIDANGVATQRTYDALGRVTASVASKPGAGETVTWSYDEPGLGRFATGRLSSMTDPTGSTTYAYDRRGLLREEAKTIGGATYTTAFQHDANGNRSAIRYPSGQRVSYTFDYADRPHSAATAGTPLVISARYLPFGPMTELVLGNGTTKTMQYDNRYRMTRNELAGPGDPLASYSYGYDDAGNVTQLHDRNDPSFHRDFGYDDLNRLTTAHTGEALWGEGSYSYDAMGNMLSLSLGRSRSASFHYAGTTPKLASVTEGTSLRLIGYDPAGNETADGVASASYTPRNHLGSRDGVTYAYDGRGLRTITTRATQIVSLVISPATVGGGDSSQATVTLSGAAPSGGALIALTASSPVVTIPSSVTIPAGQQSVTFAIQTTPVEEQVNVIVTASFNGSVRSDTLTVSPPRLDSIGLSPQSVTGGEETTATVTLLGQAPEGGIAVALESNSPAVVVPPQVVVPSGASAVQVPVQTSPVEERTRVIIAASAGSAGVEATLTVLPAGIDRITFSPASLHGGTSTTATVVLTGRAPSAGATVFLVTESDALAVPPHVVVPAGAQSAPFTATATPVERDTAARVTAILGESTFEALVRITPPILTDFTVTPAIVVGGDTATAQALLNAPAAAGGAPVQVTSSDPATIPALATIVVSEGATSETASLPTLPVAASTPVIVSATRNGVTRSTTVTVQPPPVTIASLAISPSSLIGTNPATGIVTLTDAAPVNGLEVELSSSHPTLASVPSSVTIGAGATTGTFTIATSLISASQIVTITATHGVAERTSTLTLLSPSGNYVSSISVVPPFIAGGSSASGTVTLAMPSAHASDIVLTSSNPSVLAVPAKATVKNNDTTATFTVATTSVAAPTPVTVTASFGVVQQARVIVAPANSVTLASLTIAPPRVAGGSPATGIVTLSGPAPFGGAAVAINARRRNMVSVPSIVTIPEGATSAAFVIGTNPVHGRKDKSTEIDASYNGVTATATLTIAPQSSASADSRLVSQCASAALAPCLTLSPATAVTALSTTVEKSYSLYSPGLNLLAETAAASSGNPPIAYEYVWFAGQPLAQIETSTGAIYWYLNDHLGTPVLQTDAQARAVWQPEYEPYGTVFAFRRGEARHQPLRFPGQEADASSDLTYNIARWYRPGWGRYTQADDLGLFGGINLYLYGNASPTNEIDIYGQAAINVRKTGERTYQTLAAYQTTNPCHVNGASYSCTERVRQRLSCRCSCKGAGGMANSFGGLLFGMDVVVDVDLVYHLAGGPLNAPHPPMWFWNGYRTHENLHLNDLISRVTAYANQLESNRYMSMDSCNQACGAAIGTFANWMNQWAIASNNQFR